VQPRITRLAETCNYLLNLGVVPIFNENDVTNLKETLPLSSNAAPSSSVPTPITPSDAPCSNPLLTDNDALACTLAKHVSADLVILLTDVDGVYTAPPSFPGAKVIPLLDYSTMTVNTQTGISGGGSGGGGLGRGGMGAKISAAANALDHVPAIIIANGFSVDVITRAARGDSIGTLIVKNLNSQMMRSNL